MSDDRFYVCAERYYDCDQLNLRCLSCWWEHHLDQDVTMAEHVVEMFEAAEGHTLEECDRRRRNYEEIRRLALEARAAEERRRLIAEGWTPPAVP